MYFCVSLQNDLEAKLAEIERRRLVRFFLIRCLNRSSSSVLSTGAYLIGKFSVRLKFTSSTDCQQLHLKLMTFKYLQYLPQTNVAQQICVECRMKHHCIGVKRVPFHFLQEGKLSYEEAILARQTMIKENQQRVMEMKEEVEIMSF